MPRNKDTQDYNPVVARLMVSDDEEAQEYHVVSDDDTENEEPAPIDPDQVDLFGQQKKSGESDEELTLSAALHATNTGEGMPPPAPKPQTNLFGDAEPWEEAWKGMPEFLQEDLRPARTLYVHFRTDEDVSDFLNLIDQTINPKTQYIWYPYMKLASFNHLHWVTVKDAEVYEIDSQDET